MSEHIATIVVAGRAADVWPVAALLVRELPQSMALHVVEDSAAMGAQAATVPLASDYHTRTGIDCATLLADCDAALSLGSMLQGWSGEGSRLVTAPSGSLPMVGGTALHQLVLKMAAQSGGKVDFARGFAPFRFAARAADAGKMALPSDAPDSPLAMLGPQVSFGRGAYAAMLRARCAGQCDVTQGRVAAVTHNDGGAIASVTLEGGTELSGDFFVDCSGEMAAAAGWQDDLAPLPTAPLDRMAIGEAQSGGDLAMPLYQALDDGVLAVIPAAKGAHRSFSCSSLTTDDTIERAVGKDASIAPIVQVAADRPWRRNLARLGPASAQLGPVLSADMALLQAQALLLVDCLPARPHMQAEADAFNRKHGEALLGITDFTFAPFHLSSRSGEIWQAMRGAKPSASLQTRIDQFSSRGRVPVFEREYADEQTWIELLAGMGIMPTRYDRRVDAIPAAQASRILRTIHQQLDATLAQMETQADFLRRFA